MASRWYLLHRTTTDSATSIVSNVLTWLHHNPSTDIALASVAVATGSLIVANRALCLQREVARKSGRLQKVALAKISQGDRYALGFTALNGPNKVSVADAFLKIRYFLVRENQLRGAYQLELWLPNASFPRIGIGGPVIPFRLAPYDRESWLMPPHPGDHLDESTFAGEERFDHWLDLQLEVTASGETMISNILQIGKKHEVFGFRETEYLGDLTLDKALEETRREYMVGGQRYIGLHK